MKLYIRLIHLDLDLTDTEVQNTVSIGNMKFSPMSNSKPARFCFNELTEMFYFLYIYVWFSIKFWWQQQWKAKLKAEDQEGDLETTS